MDITEQFRALATILRKEIHRFLRIWMQTLIPPAIMIMLYFIIFGEIIGSRIGGMKIGKETFDYMQFMVPGLIMMSVISNSYSNVVSSFFGQKFARSVEELLITPLPNYIILIGWVLGGVARGLMVGGIVTVVSLFFSELTVVNWPLAIFVVFLTSVLFSLGGFLNALFAESFDDISIVPTFVLQPLIYLGGVFYSIALLPEPFKTISLANPILYMVNAFRHAILGVSDLASLGISLNMAIGMILFFIALFTSISLWLLNTGKGIRS
jgi:ABC-2 type transport system permease protein